VRLCLFRAPHACADRVLSRVELWGCRSVVSTATYRRPHRRQPARNVRSWIIGRPRLLLRIVGAVLAAMVLVLGTGLGYLSFNRERPRALPQPTGSLAVGRTLFDWTDTSRPDPFVTQGQPKRELAVWLWYPAAPPAGAQPAAYLPRAWADAVGRSQGIAWQDPNSIHATAIADAPFAPTPTGYPVLLLSPGMGRTPADYSALVEDLASHGYVVAGITPTYSADVTVLGDGRIIKSVPAATLESTTDTAAGNRLLAVWRDDIEFVLGRLTIEASDPGSKLYQRLDTTRVGMLGHSFGGAAAAEACRDQQRCAAALDIDGALFGLVAERGSTKPLMLINETLDTGDAAVNRQVLQRIPEGKRYWLSIDGTGHFNFADMALFMSPYRLAGVMGPIDPQRAIQVTRVYTAAFFDTFLQGVISPLLSGPTDAYPEVRWQRL